MKNITPFDIFFMLLILVVILVEIFTPPKHPEEK